MAYAGSDNVDACEVEGLMTGDGPGRVGASRSTTNQAPNALLTATSALFETKNRKRNLVVGLLLVILIFVFVASKEDQQYVFTEASDLEGGAEDKGSSPSSSTADYIFADPEDLPKEEDTVTEGASNDNNDGGEFIFADPVDVAKDDKSEESSQPEEPVASSGNEDNKEVEEKKDEQPPSKPKFNSNIAILDPDKEAGPLSEEKHFELVEKYGGWHFWDGDEDIRPKEDYITKHPNFDVPGDDFPQDSWQTDAVYVNHYLDGAAKLVNRAMEAIFSEYGHGKPLPPEKLASRMRMFHWEKIDLSQENDPPEEFRKEGGARDIGGWTTKRSFSGLVRRLLHAMLTRDTFTVVFAGDSITKGQGNHFSQSYSMQFHRIMAPIFTRLNVRLITHNMAQDGIGMLHAGMGARDIYGQDIDLFIWDKADTTEAGPAYTDLVLRQILMSGARVPVIWGGDFELLKLYHEEAEADVGEFGTGFAGLPETTDEAQSKTLPWAARNMKCAGDKQELCNDNRFAAVCWIDREDGIKPIRQQLDHPTGQDESHPGWRRHQLQGRVLAFAVLEGLEVAVNTWMEGTMTGQPLDDDYWHVTEYYDNIRNKIRNMDMALGKCGEIANVLPVRMCNTPMNGRTQHTPRNDYEGVSLTSIIKAAPSGYIPKNELQPLYEGPDVHNPVYDIPEDQIDVLSIVMGRRRRQLSDRTPEQAALPSKVNHMEISSKQQSKQSSVALRRQLDEGIVPGEGWDVSLEPQGVCDGTYDASCAHDTDSECFLQGHHAGSGAIVGCEWSGWLVMKLDGLKEGIIVIKLQTGHEESENPKTKDWNSIDGKRRLREANMSEPVSENTNARRRTDAIELPDTFAFDYAINGKITTLTKAEFLSKQARVVDTMTLMDDPGFTEEAQDVEVAIRLRGVQRKVFFGVSHIYWV